MAAARHHVIVGAGTAGLSAVEAIRRAAERTGLSRGDVEAVFWKNAVRLLTGAGYRGW